MLILYLSNHKYLFRDLESSAAIIEELKGNTNKKDGIDPVQRSLMNVRTQLHEAQEKIQDLQEQVQEAEESAKDKSEELSDAITKLRQYEVGEYGLKDAVDEIQGFKKALKARDKQIEELMNQANTLQYENGEVHEENSELREKLGLEKREKTSKKLDSTELKKASNQKQQDRALMQVMQREIERLEEERIQLKTDNRKLAQQLGQRAAKLGLDADDLQAIQEYTEALKNRRLGMTDLEGNDPLHAIKMHEGSLLVQKHLDEKNIENASLSKELNIQKTKYEDLLEENNKLRIGMHEILDSIKEQDGHSDVLVTSPVLEKLLTILDARHFYGEYKPAMGLKTQMEKLEGANSQLREQLRRLRLEEDKVSGQNQRLRLKLQQMETELKVIKQGNVFVQNQPQEIAIAAPSVTAMPPQISASANETVNSLEMQLIHVLDELDLKDTQCKTQEKSIENLNKKFNINKHQLGLLYEEHSEVLKERDEQKKDLDGKISELEQNYEGTRAKVEEYESHLASMSSGVDAGMKKVADTARRIAILKSNEAILTRKYRVMEWKNKIIGDDNQQLKDEIVQLEVHATKTIGELQRYKEMYNFKVDSLQKAMEESVPLSSLETANRQYNEITAKYRDLLQKQQSQSVQSRNIEELELQVQAFKQEKETFKKELTLAKEKIMSLETIVNSVGTGSNGNQNFEIERLSKQLATLEVKELNERQKTDYLNNQYKLLQTQTQQIEKRNIEVEEKFDLVTKSNMDLQKTERELRDQLVTCIPKDEFDALNLKFKELNESEVLLKIENSKLKEIADISQTQIIDFEQRKDNSTIELEALRHQILDLQTQTDEKALIGRLHQQVLSLQIKDNESIQKIKFLDAKMGKMETNIFKANKRSDEMEQYCLKMKSQSNIKLRSLFKVIQDLRRQYSGAIPLLKQEKLSKNLADMNIEKQKVSRLLRETESKLKDMEEKSEEMEIKQRGVDEILTTLKHNSGTKQVLEWHSKLEDLRIKELHARRNAEQWEKEVLMLRDISKTQTAKAEHFEDEVVRLESLLEQKQLEWETKEVDLENVDVNQIRNTLQSEQKTLSHSDSSNIGLPLAKQLDSSLNKSKALSQEVNQLKNRLQDSKKAYEELNKKFRDSEHQTLAKDKIINDLRSQLPTTVDRAITITSVIGQPGIPSAATGDGDNRQALNIAQSTIDSLRERLKQKEATMTRYEELLAQANTEHEDAIKRRQDEILILQNTIRSQQAAFNELRSNRSNETLTTGAQIGQHVARIQELEDEVQELQVSVGQLSSQLTHARNENEKLNHVTNIRLQEINELKENNNIENQMNLRQQKDVIERLNNEIRAYKQENIMLKDDVERLETSQSKAPSVIMKSLVEKLRHDLAEKEKKQKAMSRAIAELKDEMIATAEDRVSSSADIHKSQSDVQRLIDKETKSFQTKISEQNILIDKLKKQIKNIKDAESKLSSDTAKLKEQLEKKTSIILKLKEEKMTSSRAGSRARYRQAQDDENEDLRNQVRILEEKLKLMNTAEKPYEDEKESKLIKNAEEVARWDERKKWQKKFEEFRLRLKEADEEVSKISKQNNNLRETVTRLDREKMVLDQKWKSHLKVGAARSTVNDGKVELLQQEIAELKAELSANHEEPTSEPGNETLKLRVKFLQGRVEQQEKKISMLEIGRKGGNAGLLKEIETLRKKETHMEKSKSKLEEDNVDLKIKVETIQHNMMVLKEFADKVEVSIQTMRSDSANDCNVETIEKSMEDINNIINKTIGNGDVTKVSTSSPIKFPTTQSKQERRLSQIIESLNDDVETLKESNNNLMESLEIKERKINELEIILRETKSRGLDSGIEKQTASEDMERYRQMEVDLKRKSDLLSEVKVLLKQAADRERSQEAEKESLKRQLKIIIDIDPKTPGEALAKELRQCRLTVERLTCEKKELEHEIFSLK